MNLLVSCSMSKLATERAKACDLYTGPLVRLSLAYAKVFGLVPFIASAKYGVISPVVMLEFYDQIALEPVAAGDYPVGGGWYVGSARYFKNAPADWRALIPYEYNLSYGRQKGYINDAIRTGVPLHVS